MNQDKRWLLPTGIEEDLPSVARRIEWARRRVIDLFETWGYSLVIPPLIEYLESLLITGDEDLDLQTLKLVDQLNGRMMGVRADMTPQVARIDARMPEISAVNRLCYAGTTLRARPDGVHGSRSPLQFGAEIYGDAGRCGDVEIIRLMLEALTAVGVHEVHIDLGHVGICSALSAGAGLDERREHELSALLNSKAAHEIHVYLEAQGITGDLRTRFETLLELNGGCEVLDKARELFGGVPGAGKALDELGVIAARLSAAGIEPHYDLAELRGYHYKTGIVFAAFTPGVGQEIARGGRYDQIGRVFGRARPATGFSGDLKLLVQITDAGLAEKQAVFAPRPEIGEDEAALHERVVELRARGTRVVQQLGAGDTPASLGCDRVLVPRNGKWVIEEV